jgi:uncharacterized damage-inducible protein DinB
MPSAAAKEQFLQTYEREHATTMKVLRAYPEDQLDFRPHASSKTARELAWIFVLERGLGTTIFHDELGKMAGAGGPPPPPQSWEELLAALEKAHEDFGDLVRATTPEELAGKVKFLVGPKQVGEWTRSDFAWFLLHDQIHHRGQFSVYLRMAGGKVPSIYGPSGDEPWM